jgi:DNA polymerase-3 subunit alpha
VESIGLVKFDFLGLRTLTIIDWALKTINQQRRQQGQEIIELEKLPPGDVKTFTLLQACKTTAVFQLESRGMKDLIRKLVPDSFAEIVALVALFRPGPLDSGMVGEYIECKHGRKPVHYMHPVLEPILRPTYGVILYQEQVMQIAQDLAGYSLGAADILRRAMGKKKPSEMAEQKLIFVDGATKRGVDEQLAEKIFSQMETFAGYGFNKSHSAAYALLSYQTAWLKAHYPAAFMAAVLSADLHNTDKLDEIIHDCRDLGLRLQPPDVNQSQYPFTVEDDRTIRYGLGAIKGLGQAAVELIVQDRESAGDYQDLASFCRRLDLQKVNRRAMEILIRSGALDGLDPQRNRARLMQELPDALQTAEQVQKDQASGQVDLFGQVEDVSERRPSGHQQVAPWSDLQCLQTEREALGLFLTGHPTRFHAADLSRFTSCTLDQVPKRVPAESPANKRGGVSMTLAGMVRSVRRRVNKGGFIAIEDHTGRLEVTLFEAVWQQFAPLLVKDEILVIDGRVAKDEFSGGYRMKAEKVLTLSEAKTGFSRGVHISLRGPDEEICSHLLDAIRPYRNGNDEVYIDYNNGRAKAQLVLGPEWRISACDELVAALSSIESVRDVRLIY